MFSNYFQLVTLISVLALLFVILFAVVAALFLWYQSRKNFTEGLKDSKDLIFFKISVPQENEVEVKSMEQFYTNLLGVKDVKRFGVNKSPHVSLEIVGNEEGIYFYVVCDKSLESLIEKAIHAVYSDAEIQKGKQHIWSIWDKEGHQEFAEYYLSKESHLPLQTYEELELDSLNSITSVLSKMSAGEGLAVQILIRPSTGMWQDVGNSNAHYLTSKKDKEGNPTSTDKDREKADIIKNKTKKEGFETVIRTFSVAPTKEIAKSNLKNLKNALSVLDNPVGNKISSKPLRGIPLLSNGKKEFLFAFIYRIFPYFHIEIPFIKKVFYKGYSILNTKELATLYHFPNKDVKTPGIDWLRSKSNIASSEIPTEGLYLGVSDFRGVDREIYMNSDDRRRHFYIIGQTGTGKSEFMKFLAIQDIKAGKGVAFMDPHGSAVKDILQQIPKERIDDVIYFNPGDEQYPMGLNILNVKTDRAKDLVINSFIELLYKLYDPNKQGIVGPQLERAVRNSMRTIMDVVPGGTMVEVMKLIIDEKYQKSLVDKIEDPIVKSYWTEEMANTQAFHKSEKTGYFVSKFDRFVTEKVMRNIIGQSESAFDLNDVMENKKILLVDLSKGVLGEENSKFLGLLLVPRILAAAFARADGQGTTPHGRPEDYDDFYFYVDEFQNFSTPDFVTILSEARKYKLNLTVANQFLSQMSDEIKNAIFGNVGTLASFRVGQDDAKYMSDQFEPHFSDSDLINLRVGNTILRLLVNGHPTPPFTMKTDWDKMKEAPRSEEVAQTIIENSRKRYGKTPSEVEDEILKRATMFKSEEGKSKSPSSKSPFSSPFSSNRPSPFSRSSFNSNKDDDKPFNSGKTPFSLGSSGSNSGSSPSPFGGSRPFSKSSSSPRRPPSRFSSPSGSNGKNRKGGFSLGSSRPNPFSQKSENNTSPFSAENKDNPRSSSTLPRTDFKPANNRPFNPSEGGDSSKNKTRGAISLADITENDSGDTERDYVEPKKTFNDKEAPPRPTSKPKTVEGEEHKPNPGDEQQPKNDVKL